MSPRSHIQTHLDRGTKCVSKETIQTHLDRGDTCVSNETHSDTVRQMRNICLQEDNASVMPENQSDPSS